MEYRSISEAVRGCLENYPMGYEFGLWDLKRDVFSVYPPSKHTHGDTISRRLRENRYGKNYCIDCIKPTQSRYKKVEIKIEPKVEITVEHFEPVKIPANKLGQGWLF